MVRDRLKLKGRFRLFENNKLVVDRTNLITDLGAQVLANIISGDISLLPDYLVLDGTDGVYTSSTNSMFSEIIRKYRVAITSPENKSEREFTIDENEAIGQIYGFGLNTEVTGGTFTNLIEQSYLHVAGKQLKIVWSIEVVV